MLPMRSCPRQFALNGDAEIGFEFWLGLKLPDNVSVVAGGVAAEGVEGVEVWDTL